MRFQPNISLLLGRLEARRCVVFSGGSGPAALVGSGTAAVAARCGSEASFAQATGRPQLCDLESAAARRAWQGRSERRDSEAVACHA